MEEKKKDSGFVVKDKRIFGESVDDNPKEEIKSAAVEEKQEKPGEIPLFSPGSCTGCGDCVRACPQKAVQIYRA